MSVLENKAVVLRFNKEFLEGGNTEILKEIVADDFINHTVPPGFPNDVTGLIRFATLLHQAFPDLKIDIHEQVSEGDIVATRKTITATHLGEIMGHAPTGKRVIINVMDFVRLRDGRYAEHWGRNDLMEVVRGL